MDALDKKVQVLLEKYVIDSPVFKWWLSLFESTVVEDFFIRHKEKFGIFTQALVVFLILFGYIVTNVFVGFYWLSWFNIVFQGIIGNSIGVMTLYCYYLTCTTDPGRVPEMNATPGDTSNMCEKCNNVKPPRAHHCKWCKRCVLKMDHHCPWVNNCIGHMNVKYYLQFLFYTLLGCVYGVAFVSSFAISCVYGVTSMSVRPAHCANEPFIRGLLVIVVYIEFALVIVLVGTLFVWQMKNIACNQTTIENEAMKGRGKSGLAPMKRVIKEAEKYDLGLQRNLREVLGDNVLEWFIPTPAKGDGMHFPESRKVFDDDD